MMKLNVERIFQEDNSLAFWNEWEEFHESIVPRIPFGLPLWNMQWWKHFSNETFGAKDELFLHAVRDEHGTLRGVVPWTIVYSPAVGPFKLRILTTLGADQSLTEIRGVICRQEDEPDVIAALEQYLRDSKLSFDAVEWNGVRTQEALEILEANGVLAFAQLAPDYILPLPESWEVLRAGLSSYMRKYMRRSYEKFGALGKKMQVRMISDPAGVAAGLERLFELHSLRANARGMFSHPDKFERKVNRDFIFETFTKLAERGMGGIFEARVDGQVVACRLCFVLGSTIYLYYSGYDPEWRNYNVGTVMTAELIQWAIKNKFKEVNLSAGRDRSKLQWRPNEVLYQGGARISATFRGGVVSRFYSARNQFRGYRRAGGYAKSGQGADPAIEPRSAGPKGPAGRASPPIVR